MKRFTLVTILTVLMAFSPSLIHAQKDGDHGYADVHGIKLYYEVHGSGKPLILLHGGLMSSSQWGPTIPTLAASRKVIAVDLQGHGRTADIDRPVSIEAMGEDVAALIKYLGIEKADIMGYSLGGGVALQVVLHHPDLINKLVLVSTPFRRNGFYPEILEMQAMVGSAMAEQMKQMPLYQTYAKENPHPQDWPRLLEKLGTYMKKDYDFTEQIKTIKAPTLVVAGDADIFPPAHAVELFGLLGGGKKDGNWDGSGRVASQLAILPAVTHYVIGISPALAPTAIAFLDAAPVVSTQAAK